VAEWSNVPDSKSGVRYPRTEGSNPSLSAKQEPQVIDSLGVFCFLTQIDLALPTKIPTTNGVIGASM